MTQPDRRLPLTVVTGFLGSGKTTFLRNILEAEEMRNTYVLVNEVADIGVDHKLLQPMAGSVVLLRNGCVCCTVRDDLRKALLELVESTSGSQAFDRIVVETTGLADPKSMIETIVSHPLLDSRIRIGGVMTLVDCVNAESQLDTNSEFVAQIVAADCVIATKVDLVDRDAIARTAAIVGRLNPIAHMVVGIGGRDAIDALVRGADRGIATCTWSLDEIRDPGRHAPAHTDVTTFAIALDRSCDWTTFAAWLSLLTHAHGERVLRVKGLLDVAPGASPVLINCVRNLVYFPEHLDQWPDADRESILVFIVRSLDPQAILRSLRAFIGVDGARIVVAGGKSVFSASIVGTPPPTSANGLHP